MPPHRKTGHKLKRVQMNGGHMDGDDWSDDEDDGVKSGSATGFSEPEGDEGNSKKLFPRKYDPVNMLLDRIDAELSSLAKSQSTSVGGSTVIQKPGSGRSSSSNHDELTTSQLEKSGNSSRNKAHPGMRADMNGGEGGLNNRKIHGTVEIYSDVANMTDGDDLQRPSAPSDLDSLAAQQVDQKFKAILRKKKGGYLQNFRASYPPSETDTIKTEDYEQKFKNIMIHNSEDSDSLGFKSDMDVYDSADNATDLQLDTTINQGARDRNETIPEEERETLPKRTVTLHSSIIGAGSNPHQDKPDIDETPRRRHRGRQLPYPSDAESVKTEDFEIKFQELLVKTQESGMDTGLESDINDPLHRKVQAILKVSSPYKGKSRQKLNGYHDDPGNRMTEAELEGRRRKNYGRQSQVKPLLFLTGSYHERDSPQFYDGDSLKYRCPEMDLDKFDRFKEHRMSTTSSSGTSNSLMSSMHNSTPGQQTPDCSMSISRTNSLSSLMISDTTESCSDVPSMCPSPQLKQYNPLMEKLFEDSITLKGMNLMTSLRNGCNSDHNVFVGNGRERLNSHERKFSSKGRELILPEEDEELPFAKYTFNKKPGDSKMYSSSEVSSGSQESGRGLPDHSSVLGWKFPVLQESSSTNWTSSLQSAFSEELSGPCDVSTTTTNQTMPLRPQNSWNHYLLEQTPPLAPPVQPLYNNSFDYFPMPTSPSPYSSMGNNVPDQILFNLGFNEGPENFLPDRFLQDWYQKIHQAKMNMLLKQQQERQRKFLFPPFGTEIHSIETPGYDTIPSKSTFQDPWEASKVKITVQNTQGNPQSCLVSKSQSSYEIDHAIAQDGQSSSNTFHADSKYLQTSNLPTSLKDVRRKQYASNRQKSLPAYLETLTEEEEGIKRNRNQSHRSKVMNMYDKPLSTNYRSFHDLGSTISSTSDTSSEFRYSNSESGSTDQSSMDRTLVRKEDGKETNKVLSFGKETNKVLSFGVPSIMINESQSNVCDQSFPLSNDSLEVLDIFKDKNDQCSSGGFLRNSGGKSSELQVEPAMMSVVLQDVDYPQNKAVKMEKKSNLMVQTQQTHSDTVDDKLLLPTTPLSGSSSSPAPMSPITVIEVNLDNQNDSLDTDDCPSQNTSLDRDNSLQDGNSSANSSFLSGGSYSKCKMGSEMRFGKSRFLKNPPIDSRKSPSPICLSGNNLHFQYIQEEDALNSSGSCKDVDLQTDDNCLAPLIKFSHLDDILKQLVNAEHESFYIVEDKEVQCDLDLAKDFTHNLNGLAPFGFNCNISDMPCASSSRKTSFNLLPQHNEIKECKDEETQINCDDFADINVYENQAELEGDHSQQSYNSDANGGELSSRISNDGLENKIQISDNFSSVCNGNSGLSPFLMDSPQYTPLKITLERLERKAKSWITSRKFQSDSNK